MEQAILPFLLYLLLQLFVFMIGAAVIKTEHKISGFIFTFVTGHLVVFALVELLAVPMILLRWKFNTLFYSFLILSIILAAFGLRKLLVCIKERKTLNEKTKEKRGVLSTTFLVVAFVLIIFQVLVYFFGMHLDEDDARWLAEANDALTYGDMIIRNASTGEYAGNIIMAKDATSPWPMLFAILSRLLIGTRVTIIAHTIYASFEILVMYGIYYLLGCELFGKRESRFAFLLVVVIINLFFAGARHTQSVFSLNRIWQGKATVASVIIPSLLYLFVRLNKNNRTEDWLLLPIMNCAGCLMSGMGLSISAITIAVYGGYHIIAFKHWRRIPYLLISVLPSVVLSLIYFYLKG